MTIAQRLGQHVFFSPTDSANDVYCSAPIQSGRLLGRTICVGVLLLGIVAGGCVSNTTELPSLQRDQRLLLTKEEQKQAISSLGQNMDTETAAAKQEIAKAGRPPPPPTKQQLAAKAADPKAAEKKAADKKVADKKAADKKAADKKAAEAATDKTEIKQQ